MLQLTAKMLWGSNKDLAQNFNLLWQLQGYQSALTFFLRRYNSRIRSGTEPHLKFTYSRILTGEGGADRCESHARSFTRSISISWG